MAEDINACVEGCFAADATEVIVRDGHGGGIILESAPPLKPSKNKGIELSEILREVTA